jgi:hypothetical protein
MSGEDWEALWCETHDVTNSGLGASERACPTNQLMRARGMTPAPCSFTVCNVIEVSYREDE